MVKFVNATFAIAFLVAGFAPINAQTATHPAPSGISQREFRSLRSQVRHNGNEIKAAKERMNGIEQTQAQENTAIINNADHQYQQDQKLDRTVNDVKALGSSMNRWLKVVSVVVALAILGGVIIVLRSRKGRSAMEQILLPANATPSQVKAYAEAKSKIGRTLPYVVELKRPDPENPSGEITDGIIKGEVHYAGTAREYYQFGKHTAVAKKRFNAARAAYEDGQSVTLHLVKSA